MKSLLPALLIAATLAVVTGYSQAKASADPMTTPLADFSYQGTLRQAIQKIAEAGKVTVEVDWNALAASGAKFDASVKVAARNATPGQLLDSALAQSAGAGNPLAWKAKDGVVRVTTQRRVMDAGAVGSYVAVTPEKAPVAASPEPKSDKPEKKTPATSPISAGPARELNFENTPLGDVLEMCRRMAGVNMHVNWKALQASSIDKNTPVSLQVGNITVGKAVDLILEQLNSGKDKMSSVYWVIDGGVMIVSTGSSLDTEMRTRTQDVADILMVVPDFKAPELDISNVNGNNNNNSGTGTGTSSGGLFGTNNTNTNTGTGTAADETNTAKLRQQKLDTMLAVIKESIGNDMWEPQGKGSIRVLNKQLVITQSLLGWKLMEKAGTK